MADTDAARVEPTNFVFASSTIIITLTLVRTGNPKLEAGAVVVTETVRTTRLMFSAPNLAQMVAIGHQTLRQQPLNLLLEVGLGLDEISNGIEIWRAVGSFGCSVLVLVKQVLHHFVPLLRIGKNECAK